MGSFGELTSYEASGGPTGPPSHFAIGPQRPLKRREITTWGKSCPKNSGILSFPGVKKLSVDKDLLFMLQWKWYWHCQGSFWTSKDFLAFSFFLLFSGTQKFTPGFKQTSVFSVSSWMNRNSTFLTGFFWKSIGVCFCFSTVCLFTWMSKGIFGMGPDFFFPFFSACCYVALERENGHKVGILSAEKEKK